MLLITDHTSTREDRIRVPISALREFFQAAAGDMNPSSSVSPFPQETSMGSGLVCFRLSSLHKRPRIDSGSVRAAGDGDGEDQHQSLESPLPEKKTCILSLGGGKRLSYLPMSIESLFDLREDLPKEFFSSGESYVPIPPVASVRWKDSVYMLSGRDLMRFEIQDGKLKGSPQSCRRRPMLSKKNWPLVLVHNDILYVLSTTATYPPVNDFESYDPSEDKWHVLDHPPFYNYEYKSYRAEINSYFVFENKICVSINSKLTFAYDVNSQKWEACTIFGKEFPWEFFKNGIVVGEGDIKYLICARYNMPHLEAVAYAISAGTAKKMQILFSLPYIFDCDDYAFYLSITALAEDYYCLTWMESWVEDCEHDFECDLEHECVIWLHLVIFQASPKDFEDSGKFFDTRICNKCKIKLPSEDVYYPGLCLL